jgi:hypothetical protein
MDRRISRVQSDLKEIQNLEKLTQEKLGRLSIRESKIENQVRKTDDERKSLCRRLQELQELTADEKALLNRLYCLKADVVQQLAGLDEMEESRELMSDGDKKLLDRMLQGDS